MSALRSATRPAAAIGRSCLARRCLSSSAKFYPGEPAAPSVSTAFPGPQSQRLADELNRVFDTRALNVLADYKRSVGNYLSDADGNLFLDV